MAYNATRVENEDGILMLNMINTRFIFVIRINYVFRWGQFYPRFFFFLSRLDNCLGAKIA